MALKFDKEGLATSLLRNLENELEWAFSAWKNEVLSHMGSKFMMSGAEVDYILKVEKEAVVAYLRANTYVLADSYGTGSLMLEDNPGYQAYRSSNAWNPARQTKAIAGRPAGHYVDLFDRDKNSSGNLEGKNIEGHKINDNFTIEPIAPSRALEDAEKALYTTYLDAAYKNAIRATNFAKFLVEDGR